MKILCGGDLHFRDEIPRRIDNYIETLSRKLEWTIDIGNNLEEKQSIAYVISGDLFDTFRARDFLKTRLIEILKKANFNILAVAGQHDLRYRDLTLENTPIGVLEASEWIKILNETPRMFHFTDFYGASYGQPIPIPSNEEVFNVLVIHKMISNKDYWNGNVEYSDALTFLEENPKYDLIISGDNHNSFVVKKDGRYLINPGSYGRQRIDQGDHKPCIFEFDTETKKITQHFIPIEPFENIMDLREEEEIIFDNPLLKDFVNEIEKSSWTELDYVKNLETFRVKNNLDEEVWDIIREVISE